MCIQTESVWVVFHIENRLLALTPPVKFQKRSFIAQLLYACSIIRGEIVAYTDFVSRVACLYDRKDGVSSYLIIP